MSNSKGEHANEGQDAPTPAPGGFVPATYQRNSKKDNKTVGVSTLDQYSRTSQHYKSSDTSMPRNKKIAVAAIIAVLLVVVGALGFYVYKEMQKQAINADLQLSEEESLKVEKELTQKKEERERTTFDEPFTVLLLGSDARADDPDMGARTDTIILVRIDPTINRISMVSIPRDTRIEIEGQGFQKFNAAYTFGGPSGTIAAVKDLTGIEIDHYAEINFEGLVGLVDAIGGIDVVVDEEIDDEDAGGHIDAGEQHLDGEHALILARSRAYVDGDYSRQANQRKVIMAIINKGLTAPATELSGLIKASTKFLKTDKGIDFDFIYDLADQIRHNNDYPVEIYTASIPSSTATIDEVSWVIADTAGVKAMMKLFKAGKDVSQGVSETSIAEDIAAARGTSVEDAYLYDEGTVGVSYYEGDDDYATSPELYEEGYAEGDGVSEYGGYEGDYEGGYEGDGEGEYTEETESEDYTETEEY